MSEQHPPGYDAMYRAVNATPEQQAELQELALSFQVPPAETPPLLKTGDRVTWMDDDGVAALVVTDVEPWVDEDGGVGQHVHFAPAPVEPDGE